MTRRRRHPLRSAMLSLLVGLAMLASLVGSATSTRAQEDPTDTGGDGGNVQGNTYVSPDFGYAISWDRTWDSTDDSVDTNPTYNGLTLENAGSTVFLEGIAGADPLEYIEGTVSTIEGDAAVSNLEQVEDNLTGDVPSTLYTFDYEDEDGAGAIALYVQAQAILDGDAILAITQVASATSYEAQAAEREDLLANLALDGDVPEVEGDQPDVEEDPADDGAPDSAGTDTAGLNQVSTPGGDGDRPANEEELVGLIDGSIQDINGFWARQFPLLSGGEAYTAPREWITWTGDIDSGCGPADSFSEDGDAGVGPFYCPPDQIIYYDLNFANIQLDVVPNSFVIPVVMAHELGHHIQTLLGLEVCAETPCLDPNVLTSQEIEYMADCWAGAWAQDAELRGRLGSGDVDANIIQYAAILGGGFESADIGGHGRGSERVWWFLNGYIEGAGRCLDTSTVTAGMLDEPATPDETPVADETPAADETPTADETPAPDETAAPDETPTTTETTVGLDERVDLGAFTFEASRVELEDAIDTEEPDEGQFAVVYFRVDIAPDGVGPFDYSGWTLVDGGGTSYEVDVPATDQLLSSAYDDGTEEVLEEQAPGEGYNLAMVFDIPADAEGLTLVNADAGLTVELGV